MATKLFLLLALCVLPVLVTADRRPPFRIRGRVYCDACRAGFETYKCYKIAGARVAIKCYDRQTLLLKYSLEALTDSNGRYEIVVEDDLQDQICYSTLVSSPNPRCKVADPGRNRATVILTRSNGAISNVHHANAMGFLQDVPAAGCQELIQLLLTNNI